MPGLGADRARDMPGLRTDRARNMPSLQQEVLERAAREKG